MLKGGEGEGGLTMSQIDVDGGSLVGVLFW